MRFALPFRIFPQALHFHPAANDDDALGVVASGIATSCATHAEAAAIPDIDAPEWNLCGRWLAYYLWMP